MGGILEFLKLASTVKKLLSKKLRDNRPLVRLPARDHSFFSPPRPSCARPPLCVGAPSPPLSFSPLAPAASAHAPAAFSTLAHAAVAVTRQERATMSTHGVQSSVLTRGLLIDQHNYLGVWIRSKNATWGHKWTKQRVRTKRK